MQWGKPNKRNNEMIFNADNSENISYYMQYESLDNFNEYRLYVEFIKVIKKSFPYNHKFKILDIGCGSGVFIKFCLQNNYEAIGIEIDNRLKKIIEKDIISNIIFEDVNNADLNEQKFDVITFWDSFEHIENAFEMLNNLKKYMTEKTIIYIRVNNNHDIYNYLSYALYKLYPTKGSEFFKGCFGFPGHVYNFSVKGMNNLCQKNGWKIIHQNISETPASRLTPNPIFRLLINTAYFINKLIKGGKIGNYYLILKS